MRIGASAGAEVRRVVVLASSASQLDAEMLKEAFDMLKHEPRLAKATLEVKVRSPKAQIVRLRVRGGGGCPDQGSYAELRRGVPATPPPGLTPTFIRCPRCGSHCIEAVLNIKDEVETT
jgi:hydrogenase nickel incorporation protein HypA/HybF